MHKDVNATLSDMPHDKSEEFVRKVYNGSVTKLKYKQTVIGTKFYFQVRLLNLTINRENALPEI